MRLVDTEEVIKAIDRHTFDTVDGLCLDEDITVILEELTTARPKRGKWIGADYDGDIGLYMCNQCGKFAMMKSGFCPNCGAEMRRQQDG